MEDLKDKIINAALLSFAMVFAKENHTKVNQTYGDGYPYHLHLSIASNFAQKYKHLLNINIKYETLAAVWLHDVLEDTHNSYNDLKKVFGEKVADIVYAVTNEKGKNRKERANDKYYQGIKETEGADFVKLVDRMANVFFSLMSRNENMFNMYKSEHLLFKNSIYNRDLDEMWIDLEKIFETKTITF